MEVRLGVLGEVKVDDDVDGLDVDSASEEVCTDEDRLAEEDRGRRNERTGADEVAANAIAEVVEDAVAVVLEHLGVRVEARVAEFGDLLGEEFDAVGRVAEDDGLVDLELRARTSARSGRQQNGEGTDLGEESVEAVDLLPFLQEGVVLSDSAKGELVHEVDLVRLVHPLVLQTTPLVSSLLLHSLARNPP